MEAVRISPGNRTSRKESLFCATVTSGTNGKWLVEDADGQWEARKAASCLLLPEAGDEVLVAVVTGGCWITAILERETGAECTLQVPGDLVVRTPNGTLKLQGDQGVQVTSSDQISLQSPRLNLTSRLARVVTGHLAWVGDQFEGRFEGVRLVGRLMDSIVERFSRKANRSYRDVTEIDQVRSGEIDYQADSNMNLRGTNILARASELAKLDGDQIHLG